MMLLKASEKTNLPLAFETIVGGGTKKDQVYNVPAKRSVTYLVMLPQSMKKARSHMGKYI